MTLVDTSVMLDVLLIGAEHGDESEKRLATALHAGPAVVNNVIAAELAPVFDTAAELWSALTDAEIELVQYPREAVYLAGRAFRRYRRRGGQRSRILPDFMIGSPATSKTFSCAAPLASTQPLTIWTRCSGVPGRPGSPGSFMAWTADTGLLPSPAIDPISEPMGAPF